MRAVRRKYTKAEVVLRTALRGRRVYCSAHVRNLPGTPDLVVRRACTAIFVDGDYWHGRLYLEEGLAALKRSFRPPGRDFWVRKIVRNVERDSRQKNALRALGWRVIRVWETDILSNPAKVAAKIERSILTRSAR